MILSRLFRRGSTWSLEADGAWSAPSSAAVDKLMLGETSPADFLATKHSACAPPKADPWDAPLLHQELWAAGVTYRRSQSALVAETTSPSVYDRVYDARRPQIFFKGAPGKAIGHGGVVGIRGDSQWTAPESELAIAIDPRGRIVGYSLANDMTARDLEADNVLYQPQAKVYRGSCAVGPCLVLATPGVDPLTWSVSLSIMRGGARIYAGTANFSDLNRALGELVAALYHYNDMPGGAVLCTGTGIIPPPESGLRDGDVLHMSCPAIGTLTNSVARWR